MGLSIFLSLVGLLGFIIGLIMLIINAVKKKTKKISLVLIGVSFVLFIAGIATAGSTISANESSSTSSSESEVASSEETKSSTTTKESESEEITFDSDVTEATTPEEINIADYNTGITYDSLARTPDDHYGDKVTLSGEVAQVIEGDDASQYRVAIDQDYDKMILIEVPSDQLTSRILENDLITIYGVSQGTIDYESTMGGTITVPAVTVDKFEVTGQAQ